MSENNATEEVEQYANATGKSYVGIKSTWWSSKLLGDRVDAVFAHIDRETEKAYQLKNVVHAGIRHETYKTVPSHLQYENTWVPKSAVDFIIEPTTEPENYIAYSDGEWERCTRSQHEIRIDGTTTASTRYGVYGKYILDIPKLDESPKTLLDQHLGAENAAWEKWHMTAKYNSDDFFLYWMADDNDIESLVKDLADALDSPVAVRESLLPESLIDTVLA